MDQMVSKTPTGTDRDSVNSHTYLSLSLLGSLASACHQYGAKKRGWLSTVGSAWFLRKERSLGSGQEHATTRGNVSFHMNHPLHPQQLALRIDTLTHSSLTGTRLATKISDFKRTSTAQIASERGKKKISLVTNRESQSGHEKRGASSLYWRRERPKGGRRLTWLLAPGLGREPKASQLEFSFYNNLLLYFLEK